MKAFLSASSQFLRRIWDDAMLSVLCFVPIAMGLVFRFGVPLLESYICARVGKTAVLSPFFSVFDLLLAAMTPVMFSAAGALVILDEADCGISRALCVTPLGRSGYLGSRLGIQSLCSVVYCAVVLSVFNLSSPDTARIVLLSLCSGALGVLVALSIPSLAKNRVEGMAISKLSGLYMLGLPAALLLPAPLQYVFGILPSFWMTRLMMGEGLWNAAVAILSTALLIVPLSKRFNRRVI